MSDASDIELLLRAHKAVDAEVEAAREKHLEHLVKRVGWGKSFVSALVGAAITLGGAVWWARGIVDDLHKDIALTRQDVHYLREHVDGIQQQTVQAQNTANTAVNMIYAAKGGYPPSMKTP